MPQMVSMTQSLTRIHGRLESVDRDDNNWIGSMGGGGVILEPAGTADTRPSEATKRRRTDSRRRMSVEE
jgi:hypothetical protein